jgi:hypothetical protein
MNNKIKKNRMLYGIYKRLAIVKSMFDGRYAPYYLLLTNIVASLSSVFLAKKHNKLNPYSKPLNSIVYFLEKQGFNICINANIKRDYDPSKKNILVALESPENVLNWGWISSEMEFVAEISYGNFFKTNNFYPATDLIVASDIFVEMNSVVVFDKSKLVSMIYSTKKVLSGHKLRYDIVSKFNTRIDMFGAGAHGIFLKEKKEALSDYMFQIAIENHKSDLYVTAVIFDCFKTKTIPIYWGGGINGSGVENLGFDTNGIIFFETLEELNGILNNISSELYYEMLNSAEYNYNKLIELRNNLTLKVLYGSLVLNGSGFGTIMSKHKGKHNNLTIGIYDYNTTL